VDDSDLHVFKINDASDVFEHRAASGFLGIGPALSFQDDV